MNDQNRQRQEILQRINNCNTAINAHKSEIVKLDAKIDSLLVELEELESGTKSFTSCKLAQVEGIGK